MPPIIHLIFAVSLIGLILHDAISTSADEAWAKKILRFVGLVAATIPFIGFIELVVFLQTDHEYGTACGRIWCLSLVWLGSSHLWRAFH